MNMKRKQYTTINKKRALLEALKLRGFLPLDFKKYWIIKKPYKTIPGLPPNYFFEWNNRNFLIISQYEYETRLNTIDCIHYKLISRFDYWCELATKNHSAHTFNGQIYYFIEAINQAPKHKKRTFHYVFIPLPPQSVFRELPVW